MKRLFVLFIAAVAGLATAMAQDLPEIKFSTTVHDFGTFPEESGKVSCSFEFVNTGKVDVILQNVRASCGCTTPNWTKTPVKPGEKGVVEATYNATGRPGAFSKTITVTSNAGEQKLTIKGNVTPRTPKVEDQFPFDMSGLRLKNQQIYMNNIEYPNSKTETIEIVNNSKKSMTLSFKGNPNYLTIKAPASLKVDEKAKIEVTFDSRAARTYGAVNPEFTVVVNDKPVDDKKFKISVFANVVENFAAMTAEQKANAPVLNLAKTSFNFGTMKVKAKQTLKIPFTNDGKSELAVRRISSDNPAVTIAAPKPLKPGQKGEIKLEINTENVKKGAFTAQLTLITNDPNKSVTPIIIEGEVK
jgi:hypothetical protein